MRTTSQTAGRSRIETYLLPAVLMLVTNGACRQKPPEAMKPVASTAPVAGPVPTGDVSDGILEGLRQELEAARRLDGATADRVKAVHPVLKCVEALSPNEWRAHFGYSNSSGHEVPISVSLFNRFWPPPLERSQPAIFASGDRADAVQVTFNPRSSTAWVLGSDFAMANGNSKQCSAKALTAR